MYCDVSLPKAGKEFYTYKCPSEIEAGDIVIVPFREGKAYGVVLKIHQNKPDFEVRSIERRVFPEFKLTTFRLNLLHFLVSRYAAFYDEALYLFLPPGIFTRARKECRLKLDKREEVKIENEIIKFLKQRGRRWILLKTLSQKFKNAHYYIQKWEAEGIIECRYKLPVKKPRDIKWLISSGNFKKENAYFLPEDLKRFIKERKGKFFIPLTFGEIEGFIEAFLEIHKTLLVLLPEIGPVLKFTHEFLAKYKNELIVYHSGLTDSQRNWVFQQISEGKGKIIIGTRSALFLPFKQLDGIMVLKAHDSAYNERDRMPMYHAREVAEFISDHLQIPLYLITLTPDVEIKYSIETGTYRNIEVERNTNKAEVHIINMREEGHGFFFSLQLLQDIMKTLQEGKQAVLLFNKKGYVPVIRCNTCGRILTCPRCGVSLTYYRKQAKLKCHLCGYTISMPEQCPYCGSRELRFVGYGGERVEEELKQFFPEFNIAWVDGDTKEKEEIFEKFLNGKIHLLIGTKILLTGFEHPPLPLIGVLNPDQSLIFPDFKAQEKLAQDLFNLYFKLEDNGKLIIQTYNIDNPVYTYLKHGDWNGFLEYELRNRKVYGYPPFIELVRILIRGREEEKVKEAGFNIYSALRRIRDGLIIYPPHKPFYSKLRGYYRWQIVMKCEKEKVFKLMGFLRSLREFYRKNVKIAVELNPESLL